MFSSRGGRIWLPVRTTHGIRGTQRKASWSSQNNTHASLLEVVRPTIRIGPSLCGGGAGGQTFLALGTFMRSRLVPSDWQKPHDSSGRVDDFWKEATCQGQHQHLRLRDAQSLPHHITARQVRKGREAGPFWRQGTDRWLFFLRALGRVCYWSVT